MSILFAYTFLMSIFNIINGIFTYKIFKYLSTERAMKKYEKLKNSVELEIQIDKLEDKITESKKDDELEMDQDFDGSFSNPFMDRELCYVIPNAAPKELIKGDKVNIPIITDDSEFVEAEGSMLNRLVYLSDFLNNKYKVSSYLNEEEWENMKWETINETYCLVTVDLPRKQAEVIRKFFRRLDTTYVKKDGTYYSVVVDGALAEDIIDELIDAYPWSEVDKDRVKVNLSSEAKKEAPNDVGVYSDKLKYAIGNLCKSVEKLNEILSGK